MEALWSIVVGALVTCGIYLVLERHILRVIFGLILLSNAVNLAIFVGGRFMSKAPPLIADGDYYPAGAVANPLPQALILTAIVIGFGLLIFTLVLAARIHKETGLTSLDKMNASEQEPEG